MATSNLALPEVAEGQNSPDVQVNDALEALDQSVTEQVEVSLAEGTATVTLEQAQRLAVLRVTDAPSDGTGVVTVEPVRRPFVCKSDPANLNDFAVAIGETSVTIGPGEGFLLYGDGTADGLEIILSGGAGGGVTREYVDAAIQAAVGSEASGGTGTLDVSLAEGDVALSPEQYEANGTFWVSGQSPAPEPAHFLDLPAIARTVTVMGDPDNGRGFYVRRGTAQVLVAAGEAVTLTTGEGDLLRVVARSRPTFRRLLDTPASYAGQGGKLLRLNSAERKIEFASLIGDVLPASPQDGQILYFDSVSGGLVWDDPPEGGSGGGGAEAFVELSDTPSEIEANKILAGDSSGDALEFKTAAQTRALIDLHVARPTFSFGGPAEANGVAAWVVDRARKIPASFNGWALKVLANPGSSVVYTVKVNGSALTNGTITLSSAGSVTWGSVADTNLSAGDIVSIHEPATADGSVDTVAIRGAFPEQ